MAEITEQKKDPYVGVSSDQDVDVAEGQVEKVHMDKDEYHLARLGYKQQFIRGLGMFENWAATFTTMNYVSGIPVLFGFAMISGGPQAALGNWTMIGGFSLIVSLSMAEIAATMPTAGGIYYWSYRLGGPKWGPFLAWMTAWWNWVGWITIVPGLGQGATNFLLAALEVQYPNSTVITKNWFPWVLTSLGILIGAFLPNVLSQGTLKWTLRCTVLTFFTLFFMYWIWLPVSVSRHGQFQPSSIFTMFYNGTGNSSNSYAWLVGMLFGAWEFYGYDASVHISEETKEASSVVARGMYTGTLCTWLMSIPTLCVILLCIQDFNGIISADYSSLWAEYCIQIVGPKGAVTILVFCWLDSILCCAVCFMSAQRITYAISRDGVLPGSKWISKLSRARMPVNAAIVVLVFSVAIEAAVIGSLVAFSAITAAATIATNMSYLIPIAAKQFLGRKTFEHAQWHLGRFSGPLALISCLYIMFLFVVLILPQEFPVTSQTLNYAPIMIGGITIISVGGWFFPKWGGRHWFKGPQRTISEETVARARIIGTDEEQ